MQVKSLHVQFPSAQLRGSHKTQYLCDYSKSRVGYSAATACMVAPITVVSDSAVVDTTFVDIYVDTKNIPTCRYNIQHIDKRTMENKMSIIM